MDAGGSDKGAFLGELEARRGRISSVVAPGKTGTSTIYASLLRRVDPLLRAHTFHPQLLARREDRYQADGKQLRLVWGAQWLSEHRPTAERPWSMVTCVRDPIARLVSVHFQKMRAFDYAGGPKSVETILHELTDRFERVMERAGRGEPDWFEANLAPVTGVSVYDHPFDPGRGHMRITSTALDLLVLRTEDLGRARPLLRSFFGLHLPLRLHSKNVADTKPNAHLYHEALTRFRLPDEWVRCLYDQRMARHFYSQDELNGFTRRWAKGTA